MTDTVEAIVAEMRAHLESGCACCQSAEFLDRLQSAHDAEVGALRRRAAEKVFLRNWRNRQLQTIHAERQFLSTLKFTRVQLGKYDSVVIGVNERLDRLLSQKQH